MEYTFSYRCLLARSYLRMVCMSFYNPEGAEQMVKCAVIGERYKSNFTQQGEQQ